MRALVLVLAGCGAKPAPPAQLPPPPLVETTCVDNVTAIPGGQLVVLAWWRGEKVRVLIDTGATSGGISQPFARTHGLVAVDRATITSLTNTTVEVDVFDAGPIRLGGGQVRGDDLVGYTAGTEQHDFTLGLAQLHEHAIVLDPAEHSFCLTRSPDPRATEPFRLVGDPERAQLVMVTARFGSLELGDIALDTGAGASTLREDLIAKIEHTVDREYPIEDSTGHQFTRPLVRIPEICVGKVCQRDQLIVSTPAASLDGGINVDGLLGPQFYAGYRLVLDVPAHRFALVPTH